MATAPETAAASTSTSAGWLDAFLEEWGPGTGEPRALREPATDRPLLTLAQSTPSDVARAAATAAAAQPAWAEATYADRAEVLRRAAEVYEANRPEIGTWTQRETGAHRNKMFHEQNFAVGEMHAAATLPYQPYGSLVPTVQRERLFRKAGVRRCEIRQMGREPGSSGNAPTIFGELEEVLPTFLPNPPEAAVTAQHQPTLQNDELAAQRT